jgi:pyruvate/2-oxoglutarate dehydrogenase complex dihydrolipoamide acyltransferase (E2) component
MLRRAAAPLLLRAAVAATAAGPAGSTAAGAGAAGASIAAAAANGASSSSSRTTPFAMLLLQRMYAHLTVAVPPMGDSISEGTVAAVLKKPGELTGASRVCLAQPPTAANKRPRTPPLNPLPTPPTPPTTGDSVVENETIAQIETDKVTIDVKAPQDGVVVGFSVKEQDTVVPGQALATLDATAAAAETASAASAAAAQAAAQALSAAARQAVAEGAGKQQQQQQEGSEGRRPAIRFPRRTTADGRRISDLSAAEAAAEAGSGGGAAPPAAKAAAPPPSSQQQAAPAPASSSASGGTMALRGNGIVAGARPRARLPPAAPREVGDRALSQLEMDMIELGGAMPYEKKEKKKKG